MATISAPLKRRLQSADPDELLDIVLELQTETPKAPPPGTARNEHYAALEQNFADAGRQVRQSIRDHGGQVIDSSWLASAIHARVPAASVTELQSLDRVELIDLPRTLTRD